NKMPLLDLKGNPIGRDTWLLGYEPAFELKQVQAFVAVIKDMLKQDRPF
ncbi:LysR family transcriptional regulator, partial [Bacillus atrophaeus]|nr:LysR family transcriptional regulator [Bacillus atrophaeus]